MFRIGEFSRIARVSMRLLRYYDEIGLLKPMRVDGNNAYRYYSAAQLPRLNRILVLKELGLSLDQIAAALERDISADELRGMLQLKRTEIERTVLAETERLRQVDARLSQLLNEGAMDCDDLVTRAEPQRYFLSVRRRVDGFPAAHRWIGALMAKVRPKLDRDLVDTLAVIVHSPSFEPEDIDAEFGFFLHEERALRVDLDEETSLTMRLLPAQAKVVSCVRIGPPEQAHMVTGRVGRFVEENGYRLAGPNREVFLGLPDPAKLGEAAIEMIFPIAPERAAAGAVAPEDDPS